MEAYRTSSANHNHDVTPAHARPRRTRRPHTLRERLRRVWDRNPNFKHGRWGKVRWRRETAITRALAELPVIIHGIARLEAQQPNDERLRTIREQLVLITPEGLGLEWYEQRGPGGGKRGGRWYVSATARPTVCAALDLIRGAYALLNTLGRAAYRESRRAVAQLVRAIRRDGFRDHTRDHPHPTSPVLPYREEQSCTSDAPLPAWLQRYARHCIEPGAAPAM